MKKFLLVIILSHLAFGQNPVGTTLVTATVTDAHGMPYAGGTFKAKLATPAGTLLNATTGNLDASGSFSVSLPPDSWILTICAKDNVTCFSSTQTISGTSQSLTSALSAAAVAYYTATHDSLKIGPGGITFNDGSNQQSAGVEAPVNSATSGGGFASDCILGIHAGINFGAAVVSVSNETHFFRCFIPAAFTIGHASINVSVNAAGTAAAGLYSCTSPYAVLVKFAFDSSTTGVKTASVTPVVIPRGCVIFAYSASSTTMQPHTWPANSAGAINGVTPNMGIAGNASTGGVLPATLGTLTGSTAIPPQVLVSYFEY